MPVKERRNREKLEMRQTILNAAKDIAAADGWQNLTIRKICDRIHYTAPVIYQYFESKEMILQSLRLEGLQQVYHTFEEVDRKYRNADRRLLEYGLAWWNFARSNAELYQVMYNLQGAVCYGKETNQTTLMSFYHAALTSINAKARRSEKYRLELCDHLMAIIHGFITMRMVNKIKSGNDNAEQVYKNALQRFIRSINDLNSNTCPKEN